MPEGCTPLSLYHITTPEAVDNILATGIKGSEHGCADVGMVETYPPKIGAVFAYDIATLGQVARIIQRVGLQLDRLDVPVIEFEVCAEDALIGEIRRECEPDYPSTVRPATHLTIYGGPVGYHEAEVFIPKKAVPSAAIKKVHKLRDFLKAPGSTFENIK